jgi:hypothetical protein
MARLGVAAVATFGSVPISVLSLSAPAGATGTWSGVSIASFSGATGVATLGANKLFELNTAGTVNELTLSGSTWSAPALIGTDPRGGSTLVVGADDSLYVGDQQGDVDDFAWNSTNSTYASTPTLFSSLGVGAIDVAVDQSGNLYADDGGDDAVYFDWSGASYSTTQHPLNYESATDDQTENIVFNSANNMFLYDLDEGALFEFVHSGLASARPLDVEWPTTP